MIPLLLGGLLSGFGAKKAAKEQSRNIDRGIAEARPLFGQAADRLNPYASAGAAATGSLASALGLGGAGSGGGAPGGFDAAGYFSAYPDIAQAAQGLSDDDLKFIQNQGYEPTAEGFAKYHYDRYGMAEGRKLPGAGGAGGGAPAGPGEALAQFRDSLGYRDTMNQALGGVTANRAARGLLGSSGAGQMFQRTAAGLANQTRGDFLDRLTGLSGQGQAAAGGQADIDTGLGNLLFKGQAAKGTGGKGSILSGVGGFLSDIAIARAGRGG